MAATVEPFADTDAAPAVRGFLHRPDKASGDGLVITHGAGGDCNAPLLVALADAFAENGWSVLRCDLPFRQAHPHGPPRGSGAEDREGLRRAAHAMKKLAPRRLFIGGQSYG